MSDLYLQHYGIKGMKWGIRRYQNSDGSLTPAGKKRYSRMSNDMLVSDLKRQLRSKRGQIYGQGSRGGGGIPIGENSRKALDKYDSDYKAYRKSEPHKEAMKKLDELDRQLNQNKITLDEWESGYAKVKESIYDYDSRFSASVTFTREGKKYVKEFVNGYGKEITIGYIRDLGYNQEVAEEFSKRILNSNTKYLW